MSAPKMYYDEREGYLELHAKRAPLGPYTGEFSEENDPSGEAYNFAVECAVRAFSEAHNIDVYLLGRSGRHVCIADTPSNRRRYKRLQAKAIEAAEAMWADMRRQPRNASPLL